MTMNAARHIALMAALVIGLAACGKKGPPERPQAEPPPAATSE
ncbi:MAG: lipoprotein [Geminicoccaceae bacterium]